MSISIKLSALSPVSRGEVLASVASLGVEMSPTHPGTRDPELANWFVGTAAGDEREAAEALLAVPGIDAAYVKPEAEPA